MKIERYEDGTVRVEGGGWYWAVFDAAGNVKDCPKRALGKPSWAGWLKQARAALKEPRAVRPPSQADLDAYAEAAKAWDAGDSGRLMRFYSDYSAKHGSGSLRALLDAARGVAQ